MLLLKSVSAFHIFLPHLPSVLQCRQPVFLYRFPGSACTNPRTVDALVNVTRSISPASAASQLFPFKVSPANLQIVSYRGTSSTFNPAFSAAEATLSDPCFARSSTIRLFGAASPAIASPVPLHRMSAA